MLTAGTTPSAAHPYPTATWPSLAARCAEVIGDSVLASSESARALSPILMALPEPLLDRIAQPIVTRAKKAASAREALRFGLCVPAKLRELWAAVDPFFGLLRTPLFDLLEQPDATVALVGRLIEEARIGLLWQLPLVEMQQRLEDLKRAIMQGGFAPTSQVCHISFAKVLDDLLAQMHVAPRLRYAAAGSGARLLPEVTAPQSLHEQTLLAIELKFNSDVWRSYCAQDTRHAGL